MDNTTAATYAALVRAGQYGTLRQMVLEAARDMRATYVPAGARDNATAQVFIDGVLVGQMSVCGHYVREASADIRTVYGERLLVPGYDHQIPARLR